MIILGIDTSSNLGTIGISKNTVLCSEVSIDMHRTHLRNLIPAIDYVLKSCSCTMQDVDLLVVVLGPGSWSGIRIGVTTAKMMAYALEKPIVGVCSLDVLAYNLPFTDRPVYPIIDAARGQVYYAGYRCCKATPERFSDYGLAKIDEFLESLEGIGVLLGDGTLKYELGANTSLHNGISVAPPRISQMRGSSIIEAGLDEFRKVGANDPLSLVPLYLQETSAERTWSQNQASG